MTAKRLFDLLIVVTTSPLWLAGLALVALVVRVRLGAPVFFRHTRPGLNGTPFTLIKFRTMRDETDERGESLPDAQRLTNFGRWPRSTSLDELPELLNVLSGEMSLVGPRPLLMEYLPLYSRDQARRHDVLPGMTGLAQVRGRNAVRWDDRLALDVWYVDHRSFALDLKILWQTLLAVVSRRGISAEGEATMPKFTGSAS